MFAAMRANGWIAVVIAVVASCGPRPQPATDDGGIGGDGAPADAYVPNCATDSPDLEGCGCAGSGSTHACYPLSADPMTRGLGVCHDGTQQCVGGGEFGVYGPCTGAMTPSAEACSNGLDDSCDGTIDCADPTCATDAACATGCTNGQTRPCYDGPTGTLGVGTCHAGTQVCMGGMWPSNCPGEVLPGQEDCATLADRNCNHLPGCFDLFACITSPACQQQCMITSSACVCPTGQGDNATCPEGMLGITNGSGIGTVECCPCTASDCGNAACCGEAVCHNNPACNGLTCNTLPPACNGQVNFDCDDFPEDCDEPCCKCTDCP
jgi:hypothetical protein